MDIIWNTPIIIKIVGVFALILLLIRRKQQLGTAFMAGAVLLGLWGGMGIRELVGSIATTMLEIKTLLLSAVVVFILILSRSLDSLGQMQRLLRSFQGLVNNVRFNLVVFPALIGLLPMPGGAIFFLAPPGRWFNGSDLKGIYLSPSSSSRSTRRSTLPTGETGTASRNSTTLGLL